MKVKVTATVAALVSSVAVGVGGEMWGTSPLPASPVKSAEMWGTGPPHKTAGTVIILAPAPGAGSIAR